MVKYLAHCEKACKPRDAIIASNHMRLMMGQKVTELKDGNQSNQSNHGNYETNLYKCATFMLGNQATKTTNATKKKPGEPRQPGNPRKNVNVSRSLWPTRATKATRATRKFNVRKIPHCFVQPIIKFISYEHLRPFLIFPM